MEKLYTDRHCPLCQAYARHFVNNQYLPADAIRCYQTSEETLIDQNLTGYMEKIVYQDGQDKVYHGIDALIQIIGNKHPRLAGCLSVQPLYFLLSVLYNFISYNRHVITMPPYGKHQTHVTHPLYRSIFILFSAVFTSIILLNLWTPYSQYYNIHVPMGLEWIICFGQILWQATAITILSKTHFWSYLGNMSMVSLLGAIFLIPLLFFSETLIAMSPWCLPTGFSCVVMFMLVEHFRRCKRLNLVIWITLSWILFRFISLALILNLFVI